MTPTKFQPTFTRVTLSQWEKIIRCVFIPGYLGQPWRYKSCAFVRGRRTPKQARNPFAGYQLLIELDSFRDCQSLYPSWWKTRRKWIRVSRRLFYAHPHSVAVFYRYHRHWNTSDSVQVKLAT